MSARAPLQTAATTLPAARRVDPQVRVTGMQRALSAWPACVVLLACLLGLATTSSSIQADSSGEVGWQPPAALDTTAASANALQADSFGAITNKQQPPVLEDASSTVIDADGSAAHEETDLSLFPDQAYNHSSLCLIPSALVPPSWYVETPDAGPLEVKRVFGNPLLVTMDRFLSADECAGLVALAEAQSFARSLTTTGESDTRTSSSVYLGHDLPLMQTLMQRASKVVGVPASHFEVGPVIRYEVGQKFDEHWDSTRDETFGRRLTFFVPLSSVEGEEGGHTAFPLLGYRFPPRNGSAVVWRNFMPRAPFDDYDRRMKHAGEPPRRGVKYAINIWVFNEPYVHWSLRPPAPGITYTRSPSGGYASPAPTTSGIALLPGKPSPELLLPLLSEGALHLLEDPLQQAQYARGWLAQSDVGILRVDRLRTPGALAESDPHAQSLLLRVSDFLTLAERQELLREGRASGWLVSETVAGHTAARTSSSAFLYSRPIQDIVQNRVAALLGVPPEWVEANALTRYQHGQYYLPHFDSRSDSVPGRRMTVSIVVAAEWDEQGGAARFPTLNLSVLPRAGTALVWRNYQPDSNEHDPALLHGFDKPMQGEVYTLTCFVFPYAIREKATRTRATAAARSHSQLLDRSDYRLMAPRQVEATLPIEAA